MSDYDENEMLEYEVEADEPETPVMPISPIPVSVCEPVVTVETVPQHMTCYTVVVDTDDVDAGIKELLPLDALRVRATIIAHTAEAIICHSRSQAQDPANTVTNVPNPSGFLLSIDTPLVLTGTQQMWVAATSSAARRVSVIVERRIP